jgi:hypothetical protein
LFAAKKRHEKEIGGPVGYEESVAKHADMLEEGLTLNRWAKIAGIIKG